MALAIDIETTDLEVAEIALQVGGDLNQARFILGLSRNEIPGDCLTEEEGNRWDALIREENLERRRLRRQKLRTKPRVLR